MSFAEISTSTSRGRAEALVLVEEISHRVVNEYTQAIASIRLAAAAVTSAEARNALFSAATRLRQFSDAHRALQAPAGGELADLGEYLERLCVAVSTAKLNERGVRLSLTMDTIRLEASRCWRVALIVSELITNAVRHGLQGGPGNILVELDLVGREVVCRVSDNGRGLSDSPPARGRTIVSALAEQLNGEVHWRFDGSGGRAQLVFPYDIPVGAR